MLELNDFYNAGFGWICRHCELQLTPDPGQAGESSRMMREGEGESKQPRLSNLALAKWADPAQTILYCPLCGITEAVSKR